MMITGLNNCKDFLINRMQMDDTGEEIIGSTHPVYPWVTKNRVNFDKARTLKVLIKSGYSESFIDYKMHKEMVLDKQSRFKKMV